MKSDLTLAERDRIACIVWPDIAVLPDHGRVNWSSMVTTALALTPDEVRRIQEAARLVRKERTQVEKPVLQEVTTS